MTRSRPWPAVVLVALGIALAMWSPTRGFDRTSDLVQCLEAELGAPVQVVQRESYGEALALLLAGSGDLGLVCTGLTVSAELREGFGAAWALVDGDAGPRYRAMLVVSADDPAAAIEDLRGAPVAWVDPASLTGWYALRAELRARGHAPDAFFGAARLTHSHDRSVEAVSSGVVRAAVIDEAVLRRMEERGAVRTVWTSRFFPSPVSRRPAVPAASSCRAGLRPRWSGRGPRWPRC